MVKRIKLGLIFSVNENWIGGTYYILNLISSLGTLPDKQQPKIIILSKNLSDFSKAQETNYKYLTYINPHKIKRNFFENLVIRIKRRFLDIHMIDERVSEKKVEVLFPATFEECYDKISKKIFWWPDFQHLYYPEFFDQEEIELRNRVIGTIAESKNKLVLSSKSAKLNFDLLNIKKNCSVHVIPFAVTHPSIYSISFESLLNEFSINPRYFIVCNQFWKHKNHFVILKAALVLKKKGVEFQLVFTGKESDYRNSSYFQSVVDFIKENQLEENIRILGMIERSKQLSLIKFSIALIQPSLFEGWSTVIEDAKALGKFVIASEIDVHKEQLDNNCAFFNAESEYELADKIESNNNALIGVVNNDYNVNIQIFGKQFLEVINENK